MSSSSIARTFARASVLSGLACLVASASGGCSADVPRSDGAESEGPEATAVASSATYAGLNCASATIPAVDTLSQKGTYKVGTAGLSQWKLLSTFTNGNHYTDKTLKVKTSAGRPIPLGWSAAAFSTIPVTLWYPTTVTGTDPCTDLPIDMASAQPAMPNTPFDAPYFDRTCKDKTDTVGGTNIATGTFPLIIFSQTPGGDLDWNGSLFTHLASRGYIVVAFRSSYYSYYTHYDNVTLPSGNLCRMHPVDGPGATATASKSGCAITKRLVSTVPEQAPVACNLDGAGQPGVNACEKAYGCFPDPRAGANNGLPTCRCPTGNCNNLLDMVNTPKDITRVLDWVTGTYLAGDPVSPVVGHVDTTKIGGMGMSAGASAIGLATYHTTLHDPANRIKAVFMMSPLGDFINSGYFAANTSVPLMIVAGDADADVNPAVNAYRIFHAAPQGTRHLLMIKGGSHFAGFDLGMLTWFLSGYGFYQRTILDYPFLVQANQPGLGYMNLINGGAAGVASPYTFLEDQLAAAIGGPGIDITQSHTPLAYAPPSYTSFVTPTTTPIAVDADAQNRLTRAAALEFFEYQLKGSTPAGCFLSTTLGAPNDAWTSVDDKGLHRVASIRDNVTGQASLCAGDCNGDRWVTADEIALIDKIRATPAQAPLAQCVLADEDADGTISATERADAVTNSNNVNGCASTRPKIKPPTVTNNVLPGRFNWTTTAPSATTVDYYLYDLPVGNSTSAASQWDYLWNSTGSGDGVFPLTARAMDAAGNIAWSEPVFFNSVNHAATDPTAWIALPANNAVLTGHGSVLSAGATAPNGVLVVGFYYRAPDFDIPTGLVHRACSTTNSIYGWVCYWDTTRIPDGNYTLFSRTVDNNLNAKDSAPINVSIRNVPKATGTQDPGHVGSAGLPGVFDVDPSVSVFLPSAGTVVTGTAVELDATAVLSASTRATKIEFYRDDLTHLIGTSYAAGFGMWPYTWNSTTVTNGAHTLISKVYVDDGRTAISTPVSITVSN